MNNTINIKAKTITSDSLLKDTGLVLNSTTFVDEIKTKLDEEKSGEIQKDGVIVINSQQTIKN